MKLEDILQITDNEPLISELKDFFNNKSSIFDITRFCRRSGFGAIDEVEIESVSRGKDGIQFKANINFKELESTGCGNIILHTNKACTFMVMIDGDANIDVTDGEELWDGEEYTPTWDGDG